MTLQYGELQPTSGWDRFVSLGRPSKFQRVSRPAFVTAATSLNGSQPNFARCLAVSCAGTLYTFSGALVPWQNFVSCKIHFASKSCVLLYWQRYCTALQQQASAKLPGMVQAMELRNFRRGGHWYSAGRPSCWASAHILLVLSLTVEALQGKMCQNSLPSAVGRSLGAKISGGRGRPWGIFFLVSTKLDTFCYPTVQTTPCYVPSFWHNTGVWRTDGRTDRRTDGQTELP